MYIYIYLCVHTELYVQLKLKWLRIAKFLPPSLAAVVCFPTVSVAASWRLSRATHGKL